MTANAAVDAAPVGSVDGAAAKPAKFYGKKGASRSSASDKWNSPPHIPATILPVLGMSEFDVDPCAPKGGGGHVPARVRYTKKQNGLKRKWRGTVYVNPPYGRRITSAWVEYARASVAAGTCDRAIMLVPARTGTAWFFENAFFGGARIIYLRGRLKFGGCADAAPFDSVLLLFGFFPETAERLADAFGRPERRAFLVPESRA